ncbi:hypothetical protein OQA88_13591 [Cercophora sp. LCS_1]
MADTSWLRSFQRSSRSQHHPPPSEAAASPTTEEAYPIYPPPVKAKSRSSTPDPSNMQHRQISPVKPRAAQRMSSFFGIGSMSFNLGRSAALPSPTPTEEIDPAFQYGARHFHMGSSDGGTEHKEPWHNPTLMQMVETLQVVMMTKSDPLAPIPIAYNSYVLSLLEGFAKISRRLKKTEEQLAELNGLRGKELEQFRGMSEEWMQRENDYKNEIRRLEVILAKESKDGVASVTLARQDSVINRSDTRVFHARLKRISNSQDQGMMVSLFRLGGLTSK